MKALIIGAGAVGVAIAASVSNENMETLSQEAGLRTI